MTTLGVSPLTSPYRVRTLGAVGGWGDATRPAFETLLPSLAPSQRSASSPGDSGPQAAGLLPGALRDEIDYPEFLRQASARDLPLRLHGLS